MSMQAPVATYRLQLGPTFTLHQAAAIVPYLAELGVSHLYLSPILQSGGASGGYDVVDPDRVAAELGGDAGLAALSAATSAAGLGLLLDIVPNHMSIAGTGNHWWLDVLENGHASFYSHYFDVDWSTADKDHILLPVLGERYGVALAAGLLGATHDGKGGVQVRAGDLRLPIAPSSLGALVRRAGELAPSDEMTVIGEALAALPAATTRDAALRRKRHLHKVVLVRRLAELCATQPAYARALDDVIATTNADPAEVDALLEAQNYRLAHWTVAGSDLAYRRFFDISTLVGLRVEDPAVFAAVHHRIVGWLADGTIDGVRVDHVDGLRDPEGYLIRLREHAEDGWIVVEKILGAGERLPETWPIDGTTGYEWMELVGGLWLDPAGEGPLTAVFEAATGEQFAPAHAARAARLEVLAGPLHSELTRLTELAVRACQSTPAGRDYTRREIEAALAEIIAGYPVYRTYLRPDAPRAAGATDRARIELAASAAALARPELERTLVGLLADMLALEAPGDAALALAQAAQQVTGAVMAKGVEDTVMYRQVRLLARCEVGAELERFATEPDAVHAGLAAWSPRALLATTTHDSKRSEDVRARIAVLSEMADRWAGAVRRWSARATRLWGEVAPDRIAEYGLWQSLVGAWPLPVERVREFVLKAAREDGRRTEWRRRDAAFEAALIGVVDGVYADGELLMDIAAFAAELCPHGDRNSLAQLLIKLTAPGVPDIYQGSELRDDSLVDPDNRRAVDFADRRHKLAWVRGTRPADAAAAHDLGCQKLWTTRRVLALRRREPERFTGPYRALAATGTHAHRVFAFARGDGLVTVVPRLGVHADGWVGTKLELPPGRWRDVISDAEHAVDAPVPVATLWAKFPIALLVRVG